MNLTSILALVLILVLVGGSAWLAFRAQGYCQRLRNELDTLKQGCRNLRLSLTRRQESACPCQTERDLILEVLKGIDRAERMIRTTESLSGNTSRVAQSLQSAIRVAREEMTESRIRLHVIDNNLRPLIGRVRQAADDGLRAFAQTVRATLAAPPEDGRTALQSLADLAEQSAETAGIAPVRALRTFRTEALKISPETETPGEK